MSTPRISPRSVNSSMGLAGADMRGIPGIRAPGPWHASPRVPKPQYAGIFGFWTAQLTEVSRPACLKPPRSFPLPKTNEEEAAMLFTRTEYLKFLAAGDRHIVREPAGRFPGDVWVIKTAENRDIE